MSERQYDLGSRYEFESVLGRGGMGVVLRAKDTVLNRPVAIKLLSDELAHIPEAQEIFLTEGRAMASLKHPNMVSVFDVVDTGSKAMMVFEFVDGDNFDDLRRAQGKIDPDHVVASTIQLCEALAYLHENGFIHRDLKPANVMVEADGKVKLIDFGLARSLEAIAERGTRVRGSPAYMSPEQFTGEGLSAASDIYALGVTLFELLSGDVPFLDGDQAFAHVHRAPPKLAEKVDGLHPSLYRLVDQCLEKTPADRPKSAREVIRTLSEIQGEGATQFETSTLLDVEPTADPLPSEIELADQRSSSLGKYVVVAVVVFGLAGLAWALSRDSDFAEPVSVADVPGAIVEVPEPRVEANPPETDIISPVKGILALAVVISENATEQLSLADTSNPSIQVNPTVRPERVQRALEKAKTPPSDALPEVPEATADSEPAVADVAELEPELKELPKPAFEPVDVPPQDEPKPAAKKTPEVKKSPEVKKDIKTTTKTPPKVEKPAEVPWSF